MDILTDKGRKTVEQEQEAIEIWKSNYPDIIYNETPKKKPADIDAILTTKSHQIIAVVETKCRVSITFDEFCNKYQEKWLVTFDKITRSINVSKALCVPFVGFLYFPEAKMLLTKKIFDPSTGLKTSLEVRNTETQATVNGGSIFRDNAYIDMSGAKVLKWLKT